MQEQTFNHKQTVRNLEIIFDNSKKSKLDYSDKGYLLITTSYVHSIISTFCKNPRKQKYDRYKVRVEDIIYNRSIYEVIEERHNRFHYQECVLKHIDTVNGDRIPIYILTGVDENIFHEILTQLAWLCNKYRTQDNNQQI